MPALRRIAALSAIPVFALLLAACGQDAPGGVDAPAPADAPVPAEAVAPAEPVSEYAADFAARGNEPFWRADVTGGSIRITQPDAPEMVATNAGLAVTGGKAIWTAQAGTTPVVLTVTKAACSDGMSDLKYDYAAEIRLGDRTMTGCGFPLSAEPREGQ